MIQRLAAAFEAFLDPDLIRDGSLLREVEHDLTQNDAAVVMRVALADEKRPQRGFELRIDIVDGEWRSRMERLLREV